MIIFDNVPVSLIFSNTDTICQKILGCAFFPSKYPVSYVKNGIESYRKRKTPQSVRDIFKPCHILFKLDASIYVETLFYNYIVCSRRADASDYLEVFVTMGTIEVSLYVGDDSSPEVIALRPPPTEGAPQDAPAQDEPAPVNVSKRARLCVCVCK